MNTRLVQQHLDHVLAVLAPSLKFINCHMVDFLTENLWEKFIPAAIREEIRCDEDVEGGVKLLLGDTVEDRFYPALTRFIQETEQFRLENLQGVLLSQNELFDAIGAEMEADEDSLNIKEFMSEKKNHEVGIVSNLVPKLISNLKVSTEGEIYVLDAGDGKGYLSSRLALEHNLNVLGIDASEINTEGAQKRMRKLQRAWTGLKERSDIVNMGLIPPRRHRKPNQKPNNNPPPSTSSTYKSINSYITKDTDFDELITNNFDTNGRDFTACLTGLHTCGNLASTCLESFAVNPRIKILCNIGCCYHLLTEKFTKDEYFANRAIASKCNTYGFPMSRYLQTREIKLGRNARMLASQSIHRTQSKSSLNTQSLFYRALLEVIARDQFPELDESLKVGKIKKFATFHEYLERCGAKCNLNLGQLETDYVNGMLENYKQKESLIDLYYLIRMSFAQIVETLILLDRLLFLKENGIEESFLIRLFDPIKSPRCYGIIAFR